MGENADKLKEEIEGFSKDGMAKVDDGDKAAYEEAKKKRAEELEKVKEQLKASGEWKEE